MLLGGIIVIEVQARLLAGVSLGTEWCMHDCNVGVFWSKRLRDLIDR